MLSGDGTKVNYAAGCIDYALKQEDPPHQVQAARTRYRRLARRAGDPCRPLPDRALRPAGTAATHRAQHQLRRHLAHIRHPIPGTRHGDGTQNCLACAIQRLHPAAARRQRLRLPHLERQAAVVDSGLRPRIRTDQGWPAMECRWLPARPVHNKNPPARIESRALATGTPTATKVRMRLASLQSCSRRYSSRMPPVCK